MGSEVRPELRHFGVGSMRVEAVVTTVLDLVGVVCLAGFAWFVWPPATLFVVAVAALVASWSMQRGGRS